MLSSDGYKRYNDMFEFEVEELDNETMETFRMSAEDSAKQKALEHLRRQRHWEQVCKRIDEEAKEEKEAAKRKREEEGYFDDDEFDPTNLGGE